LFTDEKRSRAHDELRRQEHQLFAHLLTPDLFVQAALRCGLLVICSPLNLINLVWLALSAARNPRASFAALLQGPVNALRDNERFPNSSLDRLLDGANRQPPRDPRRGPKARHTHPKSCARPKDCQVPGCAHPRSCSSPGSHDPHGDSAERVSAAAFATARQRMPSEFWVALFLLLGERFEALYADALRWGRFRLLALDGTRLGLPDYPALRAHYGTASNSSGSHNAQARLVLLQFPLARLPYAHVLAPVKLGEATLARQLLQGLRVNDLVLLDAGFRSFGVLAQVHQQGAFFCLRLGQKLNLKVIEELGSANDVVVEWQPKDSRGQWRKEGLPPALTLRRLTYPVKGYRPLQLLTNVLSAQEVPYEDGWGLTVSEEGEVLARGIYNFRWEIETTYRELKVEQGLEGGLRSRTPEGIHYEVAGHVLYYLLMRWLIVEAAVAAGVSPLRLSFQAALEEVATMAPQARLASEGWLKETLRPRLLQRIAGHAVSERPGRTYPRGRKERRAQKRAKTAQFRREQKAKARREQKDKTRRRQPTKTRGWFGNGWDLRGRLIDRCPAH
jgi:hypothetical protein